MFNSAFDDSSFGMGGGFVNSPGGQESATKGTKPQRAQNLIPVCIQQILTSPEDTVVVGGADVHMLQLVVMITNVEQTATKITYTVKDHTGTIDAVHWIEGDGSDNVPVIMENTYCQLVGASRSSQGKRHLMVYRISPVKDLNLLTTHLLSVVHAPLKIKQVEEKQKQSIMSGPKDGLSNSMLGAKFHQNGNVELNTSGLGGLMEGLSLQQQVVYKCILTALDEKGVHKNEIINSLRGKHSVKDINNALEYLSNEGHIYTTVDEDHYKTTES